MTEEKQRKIGERRTSAQRLKRVLAETTPKHLEQLTKQARALAGEDGDDCPSTCLEDIHARLSSLKVRHELLRRTLTLARGNGFHERLGSQVALGTAYELELDAWNDSVIAYLQEKGRAVDVTEHGNEVSDSCQQDPDKNGDAGVTSYRIAGKMISSMDGGRVCIRFDTSFAGQQLESYYCVLARKPTSERLYVSEHSIPFFLPLREVEKSNLALSPTKFIDSLGEVLQAYVSRREQVCQLRAMRGDQIGELYHSLSFNLIEFLLEESYCKVGVSLAYDNPKSELPTRSVVMAWPHSADLLARGVPGSSGRVTAHGLVRAEGSLRTVHLPHGYNAIVADLEETLGPMISLKDKV